MEILLQILRINNIIFSIIALKIFGSILIDIINTRPDKKYKNTKNTILFLFGIIMFGSFTQAIIYMLIMTGFIQYSLIVMIINILNLVSSISIILCGTLIMFIHKGRL